MKNVTIYLLFIFSITIVAQSKQETDTPTKVLFLGASYLNFFDVPGLFEGLAESAGHEVLVDSRMPSGTYLEDHADSPLTISKIQEEQWDYVVLQGVGVLLAYPSEVTHHPVYPALEKLKKIIKNNCNKTTMVFCLPWAFEDGMTWVEGWTDTYVEMQDKVNDNTIKYSNQIGFTTAPVGAAWGEVLSEKEYPLHYLHLQDWNHPSLRGSYLMACVVYSTLFLESCNELTYNGDLPEDEASYFKQTASDIVLNNLSLWNIATVGMEEKNSIPEQIHLYQNYPNPFNPSTLISYSIPDNSTNVCLKVFDLLGNDVATLVNGIKEPGIHHITFNSNEQVGGHASGVYFYRLQAGNQSITKKFILLK